MVSVQIEQQFQVLTLRNAFLMHPSKCAENNLSG